MARVLFSLAGDEVVILGIRHTACDPASMPDQS
ncbi:hypothetical protein GPNCGGLF_LOCUS4162 [Methylorubrum aminovorans]